MTESEYSSSLSAAKREMVERETTAITNQRAHHDCQGVPQHCHTRSPSLLSKLVTSDDPNHIHKVLGVACLMSFVYRFRHAGGDTDGNFGPYPGTLAFLALHLSLNLSSFIFDIPKRRISTGYRIWPKYRIHSLIFCGRSCACMLVQWCEEFWDIQQPCHVLDVLIVLGTCLLADWGSMILTDQKETRVSSSSSSLPVTTIRGIEYFSPAAKRFFSVMQFQATAGCLVGLRRYTPHLAMIAVVQLNAFLMTLSRKNLGAQGLLVTIYGLFLASGLLLGLWDDYHQPNVNVIWVVSTIGNVAAWLRMGPLQMNKYILWASLGLAIQSCRQYSLCHFQNSAGWVIACGCSSLGILALLLEDPIAKKLTKRTSEDKKA
ncbi:expressed unknown protein [Seminavis robusta]|uniref:Uncharacterized protein n=1 Tax=Seminavis robusta TaxID=568900 RepID=A0A9N8H0P6_9STRA|nr:expressed unknown protein [Seminavis robusta]|eukprot:Sro4_g003810.1 n/a (375) ;mRNA; r:248162-249286